MRYGRQGMTNAKIGGIAATLLALIGGGVAGFDETHGVITSCQVKAQTYVLAEYSESDTYACTDADGNMTTCTDWDYWDEPASEVYVATTIDGNLSYTNVPDLAFEINLGFYDVPMPEHDISMKRDYDFDRFSFRHTFDHTVYMLKTVLDDNGNEVQESDYTTKSEDFYPQCELGRKQGNAMVVKTWYGNAYNVEMQID